ncbi:MAG: hypothetical protein KDK36_16790 [Leptospiraceae bacterium]|nr:hypothetical protein [Leptospiraceae bacterium]
MKFKDLLVIVLFIFIISCSKKKKEDNSLLIGLLAYNSSRPANIDPSQITAASMTLNNTSATSGFVSSNGFVYYKADLVGGRDNLFGVFSLDSSLDVQITVYNSSGTYVSTMNTNSNGNLEQITVSNTASGTHYFKISSVNSSSGNFSTQIFNGPVTGNGFCKVSSYCIDNAAGSTFTSSNCNGTYYSSSSSPSTCSAYYTNNSLSHGGKCTTFSNRGAQTLIFDATSSSKYNCEYIVNKVPYIYE